MVRPKARINSSLLTRGPTAILTVITNKYISNLEFNKQTKQTKQRNRIDKRDSHNQNIRAARGIINNHANNPCPTLTYPTLSRQTWVARLCNRLIHDSGCVWHRYPRWTVGWDVMQDRWTYLLACVAKRCCRGNCPGVLWRVGLIAC